MGRIVMAMGAAAIALAGIAWAHPHPDGEQKAARGHREVEKLVIYHRDGTTREIDVAAIRDKAMAKAGRCGDAAAPADDCGVDNVRLAAALEVARTRIASEKTLGEEHRARVIASLERQIARLKAGTSTP
jgi:hypothetical protein